MNPSKLITGLRRVTLARIAGLLGAVSLLMVVLVSLGLAWNESHRRHATAWRELEDEAFFLADHASRLFEVARICLSGTERLIEGLDWAAIEGSPELHRQLAALNAAIPHVQDTWLNDATGRLRATSFAFPTPASDAADRENFKAARLPGRELFIGPPIVGKVTNQPTFLLSRRLENPDGSFRGMVSATTRLGYFEDYWRQVRRGYDARITLFRADGRILTEFPAEAAGREMVDPGLLQAILAHPIAGAFGGSPGNPTLTRYRQVNQLPVYLSVAVDPAAVRAGWLGWLGTYLPFPLFSIAALGVLIWLMWRQGRIEAADKAALVRARGALGRANEELRAEIQSRIAAEEQVSHLQKLEAIGQLTGGIAHDFNNMLAVIVGSLSLLKKRLGPGDDRLARHVETASEGAERAAALTRRLLAFARRQPLEPRTIEVNRFVAGLSDLLCRTLTEGIQLETVLAGGLWRTRVDPGQLENAIVNLAVNARDAMDGSGRLTIETANASLDGDYVAQHAGVPPGQYVLVAVTDTGSGMPPELVARAFEPFFTTKEIGRGSGLGLSQVYGFVRQSGGHVTIYSEPGQGTSVKIYLPRHYGPAEAAPPPRPAPPTLPAGRADEIVLVVEDEDGVRRLSVDLLRELGYTVRHAADAEGALRLLEQQPDIRLLFTDVVMPAVNGRELADRARARQPGLRILFTTGYTRNAVVHNGLLDPGVRLLTKPFTLEQLARAVRAALDQADVA